MRAEEGDESISDYADKAKQAQDKVDDAVGSRGNPLTTLKRWASRLTGRGN